MSNELLREPYEMCDPCRIHGGNPGCTCKEGKIKDFSEQSLMALFGAEGIKVTIPRSELYNLPGDPCYDLRAKLDKRFADGETDVFYCTDGDSYSVEYAWSSGERVFGEEMATFKKEFAEQILETVKVLVKDALYEALSWPDVIEEANVYDNFMRVRGRYVQH